MENAYFSTEFNPSANVTVRRLVKISRTLKETEYISYSLPSGNHILINNKFMSPEYECYGSCICKDKDTPARRFVNTISKTLYFIVFASSTSLAMRYSLDYFNNQCKEQFSSVCSIFDTEIEDCDLINKRDEFADYDDGDADEGFPTWKCSGNCKENKNQKIISTLEKIGKSFAEENFPPESISEFEDDIIKARESVERSFLLCKNSRIEELVEAVNVEYAKFRFDDFYLSELCVLEGCHEFNFLERQFPSNVKFSSCISDIESIECVKYN